MAFFKISMLPNSIGKQRRQTIRWRLCFQIPGLLALFLLVCGHLAAQTARLTGQVSDQAGAAIPGATIAVQNADTGEMRQLVSNPLGIFDDATLKPGMYTVTAAKEGFRKTAQTGVRLSLDTATRVDIRLPVGGSEETVVVDGHASPIQANDPSTFTEITEASYTTLPLIQNNRLRNPASFVYQAPGVQGNIRLDGNEYTGATNVISVAGGPIWNTELLIEGLPGGQTRIAGNYTESSPPVDAVNEFKITTSLLPADYGHTGFAVGSFGIKSGTNSWHSSAFEYLRNTALDEANWYGKYAKATSSNPSTVANPNLPIHQNEFGGTVGGPLRIPHLYNGKDRTFLFFAYAGSRFTGATTFSSSTTPTPQELKPNAAGYYDFSDQETTPGVANIYDPATTKTSGTSTTRKVFAGNLIPASRIDAVAQRVLSYYPISSVTLAPGKTTSGVLYGYTGDTMLSPDTYSAKLDHDLTANQHLSIAYIRTYIPRINIGNAFSAPLASGYHQNVGSQTGRVNYTVSLHANLVNEALLGYNRFTNPQTPTGTAADYPSLLGLSGLTGGLFPVFSLTSYSSFGDITDANKTENGFYFKDLLFWNLHSHSLRFGAELRDAQYNDYSPATTTGTLSFKTLETGNPATLKLGNAFTSFLLGQVDNAAFANPYPLYTRKQYYGFFAQDDWKVLPRLTINLGMRFEWSATPTEAHDHQSIVSLTTPNSGAGNLPGALVFSGNGKHTFFDTDYSAIGPRIGLAYRLFEQTSIRAGYGVYYSDILPNTNIVNSGYSLSGSLPNTSSSISPVFVLSSGVPSFATATNLTSTFLNGSSGSYYGPHVDAMPRTQNYSLSVQHQFHFGGLFEANYVGVHNTRQVAPNLVNINQVNPSYLSLGSALLTSKANTANLAAAGISLPYAGFSGTIAQALRAYPQYGTLTSVAAKVSGSNYNAMQLVFRTAKYHGLTANVAYTWSKALGMTTQTLAGNSGTENTIQNAYDPAAEYSLLPQDLPQQVVLNWNYQLPFGSGKPWLNSGALLTRAAGGWSVSGIHRYQSGFPLPVSMATNAMPIFNYYQRPNLAAGVDPASHTSLHNFNPSTSSLFNVSAFSAPGALSFGNAKPTYSDLRNFFVYTEDAQITKTTRITEGLRWDFYAQAFNPFNRHRFTGFDTAYGDSNFGEPTATTAARALQFGTRFSF